jgi:hypothetical protein
MVAEVGVTEPAVDVPVNTPVALSVTSVISSENVKLPTAVPPTEQPVHESKKSPKSTLDGTALPPTGEAFGVNRSSTPAAASSNSRPPSVIVKPVGAEVNPVAAPFVVHWMVVALALAAIIKTAAAIKAN